MCGRFVLAKKIEDIEKRFNVRFADYLNWSPSYNISPGDYAPVITQESPQELQLFRFGMRPSWSKKDMYLFNARSEGDRNQENDPTYKGGMGIVSKPAFRKPIRSQRCLVIADAFIEGSTHEGLSKPYVVYLKNKIRPFAFAGIYDVWRDLQSGDVLESFSIVTTQSNELMQKIPHHRSPVILQPGNEQRWINPNLALRDVMKFLKPYPSELMNAYPVSASIKTPSAEGVELLNPLGARLQPE